KDFADVAADPLVECGTEEVAPLFRRDGFRRDRAAVRHRVNVLLRRDGTLDQRNELQEPGAGGPEKTVNLAPVAPVGGRDDGEQVVLDLMALQKSQSRQHAIEGRATALVVAMAIMELARTIQADAHEKALAVEKPSPVVGE